MKKWQGIDIGLAYTFIILIVVYLGIKFFTGHGPNYVGTLFLYAATACSIQLLFSRVTKWKIIKFLPLILTAALAGWGTWLYLTSIAWKNATIIDLLIDYVSPFGGSLLGLGIYYIMKACGEKKSTPASWKQATPNLEKDMKI